MKKHIVYLVLALILAGCGEPEKEYTNRLRTEWIKIDSIANHTDDFQNAIKLIDQFLLDFPEDHEFGNTFSEDAQRQKKHLTYLINEKRSYEEKQAAQKAEMEEIKTQFTTGENSLLYSIIELTFDTYKNCGSESESQILTSKNKSLVSSNFSYLINPWYLNSVLLKCKETIGISLFHEGSYATTNYDIENILKYFDALYQKPGTTIAGFKTENLYKPVRNDLRKIFLSFIIIENIPNINEILERFSTYEEGEDYDYEEEGYDYEREPYDYYSFYQNLYSNYFENNLIADQNKIDLSYVGSCYRRMMDGTAHSLTEKLFMVLNDYDREWLNKTVEMKEDGSYTLITSRKSSQPTAKLLTPVSGQNETVFMAGENLSNPRPVLNYTQEQIIKLKNKEAIHTTSPDGKYFYLIYDSVQCYETESGILKTSFSLDLRESIYNINDYISVSPDGNKLACLIKIGGYYSQYLCIIDIANKSASFRKCPNNNNKRAAFIPNTDKIAITASSKAYITTVSDTSDDISEENSEKLSKAILAVHPSLPVIYTTTHWINVETNEKKPYNKTYENTLTSISADGNYLPLKSGKDETTILRLSEKGAASEYLKLENINLPLYWINSTDFAYMGDYAYKIYSLNQNKTIGRSITKISPKHSNNQTVYAKTECGELLIWKPLE